MKSPSRMYGVVALLSLLGLLAFPAHLARAASVGPSGYTNSFDLQPSTNDWATVSRPGGSNDPYDVDTDVNTNGVSVNIFTNPPIANAGHPPGILANATWSSTGLYLQTRPSSSRYTMLLGKFQNDTGTNATEIGISYRLTFAGNAAVEDTNKGTRLYYSFSGATNSWTNLAAFNTTLTNGSYVMSTNLVVNWPYGTNLFLLWVDDNALPATDVANQIDDFSLRVNAGDVPGLIGILNTPAHNTLFLLGATVRGTVSVFNGTSPYVVQFWTNSGSGNTIFSPAATAATAPYELNLGALSAGTYNLYATVTDANGAGFTTNTLTNTFFVVAPMAVAITAPTNGATFDRLVNVIGTATVSGGTDPYSVQFFVDGVSHGSPVTSAPYTRDFGTLSIDSHTISATVTDGRGWRSNSVPVIFRVTAPLGALFAPVSGASLFLRQALIVSAFPFAGEPPYSVSFYTNGQFIGTSSAPPFTTNLGLLPLGSYTLRVDVADSSVPPQRVASTNIVTVVPSPPLGVTHAVQVSLDGLGAKYLEFFLTNAPAEFPNFVRLTVEGAFTMNARCDYDISETVPNHASMFTGRPVFQPAGQANTVHHGFNNNFPGSGDTLHASGNPAVPYKASMFDVAHDYGLLTALYTGKTRLSVCELSYSDTNGAPDLVGVDNGQDKIDISSVADVSGTNIVNQVSLLIQNLTNEMPARYSFIHIAEPDITGHASGWRSANWSNMVRAVDAQIGRIMDTIDAHPLLSNRTALIITADHGGGGVLPNAHTESFHITNYTIPFFIRAPGIPPGADIYSLFANRAHPYTNRTDYNTRPQPVRNGDASNLALKMLGLPPIPGSLMVPQFYATEFSLSVARFQGQVGLFWDDEKSEYILEASASIAGPWQTIENGITTNETARVFSVTNAAQMPLQFFRLRSLHD